MEYFKDLLWVVACLVIGVLELATVRTIRPPKKQTFAYIRLAANQYQTVFAPALGALISGLFVSLAASFFYASFTEEENPWPQLAGLTAFVVGAVALTITLWSVLKGGAPEELARDPFSIRAAADESAAAPRSGALAPAILKQQLDEWKESISARSLNLGVKGGSERLNRRLSEAAQKSGFWTSALRSLCVYYAALLRFPLRFLWPVLGFVVLVVGVVWHGISLAGVWVDNPWQPWGGVCLVAAFGLLVTVFYCATRGNRARLWHRINLVALEEARDAISQAEVAHKRVAAEEERVQRILSDAAKFFRKAQGAQVNSDNTLLRFGKFRVSKTG